MKKLNTKHCDGCGKREKLEQFQQHHLCPQCLELASLVAKNTDYLPGILEIVYGKEQQLLKRVDQQQTEISTDLPDVLDAIRYRTRDRDNNSWYVSVSEMSGQPVEIFASTAFDRDHHLQSRISNLTTITRLISLILRNVFMNERLTLEKILTQLRRSSRQPNDLPAMLAGVLENYSPGFRLSKQHNNESP